MAVVYRSPILDDLLHRHRLSWEGHATRTAAVLLAALNWCDTQPLCKGNLGIPRRRMPQIRPHAMTAFLAWAKVNGVGVRKTSRRVKDLRATQLEIDPEMVDKLVADGLDALLGKRPMLASEDGYILDGHHRWAALLVRDPESRVDLLEVQAPVREVLALARAFPQAEYSERVRTVASLYGRTGATLTGTPTMPTNDHRPSAKRVAELHLQREGARGRRRQGPPTPTSDMAAYMEQFEAMMMLPYPAIYNALGIERNEVGVKSTVSGGKGNLRVAAPGGTDIEIVVEPDGDHVVSGKVRGQALPPRRFKFRPADLGWTRGTQGDIVSYVEDNFPGTIVYKVCRTGGGGCEEYPDLASLLRDHRQTGTNTSGRPDLRGQPTLAGLVGPMWDGRKGDVGVVRYDTPELHDQLSR